MDRLYSLDPKAIWSQFKREHFSFWMICAYLILEYVRPQSIIPSLDVLPWDKIIVALTVLGLLADPQKRWVKDRTNIWMTLFLAVIIVSSVFADYPAISWSHWFDFVGWYLIYFLVINAVTSPQRYLIFLTIYLLANFKLSFFGARTWATRGFGFQNWGILGPPGFFTNSSDLSIEMLMFSPVAFELALYMKPRVKRAVFWGLMFVPLTGAMTVLGASSRGAQLGLAAQAGQVAYQRKLNLKVLIAVALIAWGGYSLLPQAEKARFSSAGDDNTSIQRLDYWKAGVQMIKDHPVLGVGYFNFPRYYEDHYPLSLWHGTAQLPHNIFIQVGTDAGLVGLGIFLMLIYRNLQGAKEIQRACAGNARAPAFAPYVARGLASATIGFVIAGQFDTVTYYPFLWMNLTLTVALANVVARAAEHAPTPDALPRPSTRAARALEPGVRPRQRRPSTGRAL
jgi:O-antigen ligase